MKKIHYAIASSAVTLALLTATPALAHSNGDVSVKGSGNFGLGSLVRLFDKHDQNDDRGDKNKHDKDDDRNATSTANSSVSIVGTISALTVSGFQITVNGNNGTTYTVDASGAKFSGKSNAVVFGDLKVGDTVAVHGKLSGTAIVASSVRDLSIAQRIFLDVIGAAGMGVVTSVNGSTFTIKSIGKPATTTVTTNASTTFKVNGQATSSSALGVGSKVIVTGTSTTDTSISASIVSIWNHGLGFLKRVFHFHH